MELSSKEFFEKLNSGNLKPSVPLIGTVKPSEKESEVLFARKGDFNNWVHIPSSMVDSADVIKSFNIEEQPVTLVKLSLKTPSTAEGKVLYDLLTALPNPGFDNGGHFMKMKKFMRGKKGNGEEMPFGMHEMHHKKGSFRHGEYGEGSRWHRRH